MATTRSNPALSTFGERGFLKSFLPRLSRFKSNRFLVLPGDDAAVMKGAGRPVLSIDGLTEGTHFKSVWDARCRQLAGFSLARGLGWKLLGSGLSDLAAMGRTKNRWAMTYLGAPGHLRADFLKDLYRGIHETAQAHDCALVGGDTVRAKDVSLVSAVGGELIGRPLTRAGAHPGDWICVAGTVGDAAIGLKILQKKIHVPSKKDAATFVRRFFKPAPLFGPAAILSQTRGVTSLIDLSDALRDTLEIVSEASGVGLWVDVSLVPVSKTLLRWFKKDPTLLSGGEDYSLLFTARSSALKSLKRRCDFSVIGRIQKKSQGIRYLFSGRPIKAPAYFQHFK